MGRLDELMGVLALEPTAEGRFRAENFTGGGGGVVFGGQLLAQTIVAGATVDESKAVKSVSTIFARGGDLGQPLDIEVEPLGAGRSLSSATVTVRQGSRTCTRSLVLLSAEEPDFIRHGDAPPEVGPPSDAVASDDGHDFWELRVVDGVSLTDPDAVGPPDLCVWSRFPGAEASGALGQALLAYATDGFLIGTAMRPHPGVGQAMSHVTVSTSVLAHTLSFHEPIDAAAWHLLAQHGAYAGHGRAFGHGSVFSEDGRLVASFVQESMIRAMPDGRPSSKF